MALLSDELTDAQPTKPEDAASWRPSQTAVEPVPFEARDPFATDDERADRAAAADGSYEAFSIEDFPEGIADLSATHEDARGFHDYVAQFTTPNYWFRDGGVLAWAYGEDYDNWQDFYGFDSACAVYHSGHGGMDSAGVFQVPMGGEWGGNSWVFSNAMRLGNERARYVFWSTCLSLRVHDGMSPITTWHAANGGMRMLFGFETTSVDSGDYGKFFFEEWNANKSFSQAWLDASWRIDHTQAPSVLACGVNQADAEARLNQERLFFRDPGAAGWYAWRWYDAATDGRMRAANLSLPDRPAAARVQRVRRVARQPRDLAERFGFAAADLPHEEPRGALLRGDGVHLAIRPGGGYEVRLRPSGEPETTATDSRAARAAADEAVRHYGLADDVDLIFDRVRLDMVAGGTPEAGGALAEPRVRERVVHYRQVVNDVPVVSPDRGEVRVAVNGEGEVTAVADTTVDVLELVDRAGGTPAPQPEGPAMAAPGETSVEELLSEATRRRLSRVDGSSRPGTAAPTPVATEVGYATDLQRGTAVLVARRTVEVDRGQGLRKRYVIQVPIIG